MSIRSALASTTAGSALGRRSPMPRSPGASVAAWVISTDAPLLLFWAAALYAFIGRARAAAGAGGSPRASPPALASSPNTRWPIGSSRPSASSSWSLPSADMSGHCSPPSAWRCWSPRPIYGGTGTTVLSATGIPPTTPGLPRGCSTPASFSILSARNSPSSARCFSPGCCCWRRGREPWPSRGRGSSRSSPCRPWR